MRLKALILLTSLSIITSACGQSNINKEVETEVEIIETEAVETEQTTEIEVESELVNEVESTEVDIYESLDTTKHMTKNEDGTYSFSEEFMGTLLGYSYFENATEEEVNAFLQELGPLIEGLSGEDVANIMILFEGGNLHSENETIKQSEGTAESNTNSNTGDSNSGSSSNSSSSGNSGASDNSGSSGGGVAGSGDSLFGDIEGNFGGDPGELPEGYTGIH